MALWAHGCIYSVKYKELLQQLGEWDSNWWKYQKTGAVHSVQYCLYIVLCFTCIVLLFCIYHRLTLIFFPPHLFNFGNWDSAHKVFLSHVTKRLPRMVFYVIELCEQKNIAKTDHQVICSQLSSLPAMFLAIKRLIVEKSKLKTNTILL